MSQSFLPTLEAFVGPQQRAKLSQKKELKKLLSGPDQLRHDPAPRTRFLPNSCADRKEGDRPRAWTVVWGRKGAQWLPPAAGLPSGNQRWACGMKNTPGRVKQSSPNKVHQLNPGSVCSHIFRGKPVATCQVQGLGWGRGCFPDRKHVLARAGT